MKNIKMTEKIRIIISISVTFAAASLLWIVLVVYFINTEAIREAEEKTALMSNMTLSVHSYFSNVLKPHLFEQINKGKFECDFDPIWMSSSYVINNIKKDFSLINNKGYEYKHSAINARNYLREAKDEEKAFIIEMIKDRKLTSKKFIKRENGKFYYYFFKKGELLEDSCMKCHGKPDNAPAGLVEIYGNIRGFNKKQGDIASVEVYKIPIERMIMNNIKIIIIFSLLFIVIVFFKFIFITSVMNNWIFKPLQKIKLQTVSISKDTSQLDKSIKPEYGPILNEIIEAFNNMNKKLLNVYYEQDKLIDNKTKELKLKNNELENILVESNHRIKNNLMIISGLISFRMMSADSESSRQMLKEIDGKIKAFSLIHEKLYNHRDYLTIETGEYFNSLFQTLVSTYNVEQKKIKSKINFISMNIDVKIAVNISIVMSEFIVNAFKYGLDSDTNILDCIFIEKNDNLILSCKNSCKKVPALNSFQNEKTLGFNLINDFVRKYKGKININLDKFVEIVIIFPKKSIVD